MDTIRLGALDVMVKPPSPESPGFDVAARDLVTMVKAMAQVKVVRHWRPAAPAPLARRATPAAPPLRTAKRESRCRLVAIVTSTGGPGALQCLFSALPAGFGVPVVVVQHMTPGFTVGLASWLATVCPLRVKVGQEGERLMPGTVYLAPDGLHLGVTAIGTVALSAAPPVGGFRPSGTFLFESVARAYGPSALAVILTGMGEDGVEGLRAIRSAEGMVIAQDEETSVVFGMPAAAIAAGLANTVLAIDAIAPVAGGDGGARGDCHDSRSGHRGQPDAGGAIRLDPPGCGLRDRARCRR